MPGIDNIIRGLINQTPYEWYLACPVPGLFAMTHPILIFVIRYNLCYL